jgi:hypothetical protein
MDVGLFFFSHHTQKGSDMSKYTVNAPYLDNIPLEKRVQTARSAVSEGHSHAAPR